MAEGLGPGSRETASTAEAARETNFKEADGEEGPG